MNLLFRLFAVAALCFLLMPIACMDLDISDEEKLSELWDNYVVPEKFQVVVSSAWDDQGSQEELIVEEKMPTDEQFPVHENVVHADEELVKITLITFDKDKNAYQLDITLYDDLDLENLYRFYDLVKKMSRADQITGVSFCDQVQLQGKTILRVITDYENDINQLRFLIRQNLVTSLRKSARLSDEGFHESESYKGDSALSIKYHDPNNSFSILAELEDLDESSHESESYKDDSALFIKYHDPNNRFSILAELEDSDDCNSAALAHNLVG